MGNQDKKVKIKVSAKQKKYLIAEIVIATLMILLLIAAKIFNFDNVIVMKVLEGCTLVVIIIMNIMIVSNSK